MKEILILYHMHISDKQVTISNAQSKSPSLIEKGGCRILDDFDLPAPPLFCAAMFSSVHLILDSINLKTRIFSFGVPRSIPKACAIIKQDVD